MTYDGHSFGLYKYNPALSEWTDQTAADANPDSNWPPGREDHGFTYDASSGRFYVFGGEGAGSQTRNDLWSYNEGNGSWSQIPQTYNTSDGATIDPREIYNITDDNQGSLYLFGGAYLTPPANAATPPLYVNDLWRFSIASHTWTLLEGKANDFDPTAPLPRHYYGQASDPSGNFYILGGYLADSTETPAFQQDDFFGYAIPFADPGANAAGLTTYALSDFWQYNATMARWVNMSNTLQASSMTPTVPYVMVDDTAANEFLTFSGLHPANGGDLSPSDESWSYGITSQALVTPPTVGVPAPTTTATNAPIATMAPTASSATPVQSPSPGIAIRASTTQVAQVTLPVAVLFNTGNTLLSIKLSDGNVLQAPILPSTDDNPDQ